MAETGEPYSVDRKATGAGAEGPGLSETPEVPGRALLGTKLIGSFKGERFILGDVEAEYSLDHGSMQDQMSAAWRPGFGGHVIFTVAAPGTTPEPVKDGNGARQLLITPAVDREIDGYYATIADPDGIVTSRYGLRAGGTRHHPARWLHRLHR